MIDDLWSRTVTLEIAGKRTLHINGTRQAAAYLIDQWSGMKDGHYRQAIMVCADSLKGNKPKDDALWHFVSLTRRSNMPISLSDDWSEPDQFVTELLQASLNHMRVA